ncbi:GDYXXLXY domain-containing protein [Microbulbifer sediminum]|uniref:GDYXXLXY domain-containing protein n=1 Tax=Microbulbifer sediminum TaxID=2904250 RepID=UPI001F3ADE7F|nr:GDYXXLXY domain-containing protein [Microbulbifer sediminum]
MKPITRVGLALAILLQFLVLTGMYLKAQIPLWTGEEILVKTIPVDPRSMFRGNYARLRYPFSELDASLFGEEQLRQGEVVYVALETTGAGVYRLAGASLEPPEEGIFLRGRVSDSWFRDSGEAYRVRYGIEAFFAPKEEALRLEKVLRKAARARLKVSGDGRARLVSVEEPTAR